jgi:hypothetical protein
MFDKSLLFMQNKPNFVHISPKKGDFTKKQTQFKPNQSQFWANIAGGKAKQTQFKPNLPPSRVPISPTANWEY